MHSRKLESKPKTSVIITRNVFKGIRVPAFIWSPLLNKTGYVSNALIHVSDVLPTLLDAIGAENVERVNQNAKYPTYGQIVSI